MSIIYFDVTNVVRFAESNDHVTGIQRVQLRLITDLMVTHCAHKIRGLAHLGRQGWRDIDLTFLTEQSQFNAVDFLLATGCITASRFPSTDQIKRHLAPYNQRKFVRSLRKVGLYAMALISTSAIRDRGFQIYDRLQCESALRSQPFKQLRKDDVLAILGETGANPPIERLATRHHANGGLVVQMIHDVIPCVHPEYHTARTTALFKDWLERSTRYVGLYICNSQNTARDLVRSFEAWPARAVVEVVPLAHEFSGFARSVWLHPPEGLASVPYVLCVGSIEIRKNGANLLKAWQQVLDHLGAERCPKLVFAGKKGWKAEEFHALLASSSQLSDKVVLIESPSDAALASLYRHSLFTVYPSLYEGWGLPVGESAWFNKFGVVSGSSSLSEVCGELMDYIDPHDAADIAMKLLRPLKDAAYLQQRSQQVQEAILRTWQDVAANFLQQIQRLRHT